MDPRPRVLELLRRHGWNATSFQVLEPGLAYWFQGDDACVAYVDTGLAWVVAGAPIAPAERIGEVATHFAEHAARSGRRLRWFAVEERFLAAVKSDSMQVGEQAVWDPAAWDDVLRATRSLREQLRRARAKGVRVRLLSSAEASAGPVREAIDRLIERWIGARQMAPMGFLVALHPFDFPEERRYFVAERDGAVVGFLAAVPVYARNGWFLEDLLRDPAAPNGTSELLVDAAFRMAAAEGSRWATMGLAPLAGVHGWLAAARKAARELYDFGGLWAFKAKLRPQSWEPIHLAYPRGDSGLVALSDVLAAFSRGGLLRFGIETLLRVPNVVLRLLAVLLVPWTIALALADPTRWFPAPWVKWAWVGFDAVLFGLLWSLTRRWRHGFATLVAALVTADASITLFEVLRFNLPRLRAPAEPIVLAIAVLGPTLAALLLWRARWHRRRVGELTGISADTYLDVHARRSP